MNIAPPTLPFASPVPATAASPAPAWRQVLSVRVVGIPKAQPRARAFARNFGGKFSARMYDPGTAEAWKADIARALEAVWDRQPLVGPVAVSITFLFPRPKKMLRAKDPDGRIYHAQKPDRDNCEKAVLDCLTRLRMWADDGQVCAGEVVKLFAGKSEQPGAEIRISILEGGNL